MEKEGVMFRNGQIFSTDTIIGSVIFMVAVAAFYANLREVGADDKNQFAIEQEFVFNNIIANTAAYDRSHADTIAFLNGTRIEEKALSRFARFAAAGNYTFVRSMLLANVVPQNILADACLFFTNTTGNIIPVRVGTNLLTGVGNKDNPAILIEAASPCGAPSRAQAAAPQCALPYFYTRELSKPVTRQDPETGSMQLAEMRILICATNTEVLEEESILYQMEALQEQQQQQAPEEQYACACDDFLCEPGNTGRKCNGCAYEQAPAELCDSYDNDCDGGIDEGLTIAAYRDADNDGYGSTTPAAICRLAPGYAGTSTDCNDNSKDAYPGAAEICDNIDNNCNGQADEGLRRTYYRDADSDGYGGSLALQACSQPAGYVAASNDCDDSSPARWKLLSGYADADGDSYVALSPALVCSGNALPAGYGTSAGSDCDDSNRNAHPDTGEVACNAVDEDCNSYARDPDCDGWCSQFTSVDRWACSGQGFGADYNSGCNGNIDWNDNDPQVHTRSPLDECTTTGTGQCSESQGTATDYNQDCKTWKYITSPKPFSRNEIFGGIPTLIYSESNAGSWCKWHADCLDSGATYTTRQATATGYYEQWYNSFVYYGNTWTSGQYADTITCNCPGWVYQ